MLRQVRLIRNVGQFDSAARGTADARLEQLSLIFAENGRGKTTLAAILRSLKTGNSLPIRERHRLNAQHPPHVVLDFDNPAIQLQFQNDLWSGAYPNIQIFDDQFIAENVHQGPVVNAGQRQKLHELVLGEQGVLLNRRVQELVTQSELHSARLRNLSGNFTSVMLNGMTIDDFCDLQPIIGIDEQEQNLNRRLAAATQQEQIQIQPDLAVPAIPDFNLEQLNTLLRRDIEGLEERAVLRVREHISLLGPDSESWVAQGLDLIDLMLTQNQTEICPFCAQGTEHSPVLAFYRGFFSAEYRQLQTDIAQQIREIESSHGTEALLRLERLRGQQERDRQFWANFINIPDIEVNTPAISEAWSIARDAVLSELRAKAATPLVRRQLSTTTMQTIERFRGFRTEISAVSERIRETNQQITDVRARARTEDVAQLRTELRRITSFRARFQPNVVTNCEAYMSESFEKERIDGEKRSAQEALERYQQEIFLRFEESINRNLERFGASYRIREIRPERLRFGNFCNFEIEILGVGVAVAGGDPQPGSPSFANTLSAGDRSTLALAFFLANLEAHQRLTEQIVVIDDPLSSLDEHRHVTTTQIIQNLIGRVQQIIVMSHNPAFLARICDRLPGEIQISCFRLRRDGMGSEIVTWDRSELFTTDHDRRDQLLRAYQTNGTGEPRIVATAIRPHLEGYLRVICPSLFRHDTRVGQFVDHCRRLVGTADEILSENDVRELSEINDFSSSYHHDTNPTGFLTATINETALNGFVGRTLRFTGL